jgi:large subunit ribosomal protein L32
MPHPKKRRTRSDKGTRRSHHALEAIVLTVCKECGKAVKPHHACMACGFYDGKNVLKKKEVVKVAPAKKTKTAAKKKAVKKEEGVQKKEVK